MVLKRPGALLLAPKRKILGGRPALVPARPAKATGQFDGEQRGKPSEGGAFAKAGVERKKQELARNKPWNVQVPVGGELIVYLLDSGEPWNRYEHKIGGGPNSRGVDYPCIKDTNENCPLCQKEGKEGTYVMYCTAVIPREEYTKQGEREPTVRHYQKKLFPIKSQMSAKYERAFKKYGSMRGLVLKLSRDTKKSPTTGNDFEVLRVLTEKEIQDFATASKIKNKESRDLIIKAQIDKPFDYEKIMPTMSAKDLGAIVGMKTGGSVGSSDFSDDGGDHADDAIWGGSD